jgi:hypothetical protein
MNQEFEQLKESILIEVIKMKMHLIQFVSIVNLIQMKLMKMIYNRKNIPNQEIEQSKESQLIEVMNMKMLLIQFALIVFLIQMKWREIDRNHGKIYISELKSNQESKHEQHFHRHSLLTSPSVFRWNHPGQQFYVEKIHSFDLSLRFCLLFLMIGVRTSSKHKSINGRISMPRDRTPQCFFIQNLITLPSKT